MLTIFAMSQPLWEELIKIQSIGLPKQKLLLEFHGLLSLTIIRLSLSKPIFPDLLPNKNARIYAFCGV